MMTKPAKLTSHGAHQRWACPCCNRTLGEVYGDRVVVKAGERLISFPRSAQVNQTCPSCATESAIEVRGQAA